MLFNKMYLIVFSCLLTVGLQYVGAVCPAIVTRNEWDSDKAISIKFLPNPLELVIIQHTVTQTCSDDQSCLTIVQDIQKTHMNKNYLWDIGPSFLIANTGKIYEGRGWYHVAVHTFGYNNQSVGIAFIGNFNNEEPSVKALNAARALIQCGVDEEILTDDHKVIVHSQLLSTLSPGEKLASKIMTWPDWKQDVTEIKKQADTVDVTNLPGAKTNENGSQNSEVMVDINLIGKPTLIVPVLTTAYDIDLLSNARNIISELISNLRNLAQQTLKTVADISKGLTRQVSIVIDLLASALGQNKNQVNVAVLGVSSVFKSEKCAKSVQNRANNVYDNIETNVNACIYRRVNEIDNMIKNLDTLSNNAIDFTNTAVEETRNCTELNFGIEVPTKACLNSVTRQTQSATKTFESQKTLALKTIRTALDALPAALDLCSKKPLSEVNTETAKMISEVSNCRISTLPWWSN